MNTAIEVLPNGAIRLTGHRIGLEHVIELHQQGLSAEQIAQRFIGRPDVQQVAAALAYYYTHQAEVDAYLARVNAAAQAAMCAHDSQPVSPTVQRIRRLRAAQ